MEKGNCGRNIVSYVRLLIIKKKLNIRNEVVERANSGFEGNKKEFWAFVNKRKKREGKRHFLFTKLSGVYCI